MPNVEKVAFRVREAERAYSIPKTTIYALMREGKLATAKVAGRRLILRESLDRLLGPSTGAAA